MVGMGMGMGMGNEARGRKKTILHTHNINRRTSSATPKRK
jgi:hypothetical protein